MIEVICETWALGNGGPPESLGRHSKWKGQCKQKHGGEKV